MQISGHGRADHLATLLLGTQEGAPAGAADVATPPAAPHKNEINALAIVWGLIKGWLAG